MQDKTEKLGRWLGPCKTAFDGGDCFYILTVSGKLVVTNTTRSIPTDEWNYRDFQRQMDSVDSYVRKYIGEVQMDGYPYPADLFEGDDENLVVEPDATIPDVDSYSFTPDEYDECMSIQKF